MISGPKRRPTPRASFSIRPGWLEGSDQSTSVATTDLPAPDITIRDCACTNKSDRFPVLLGAERTQTTGCLLDTTCLCRTQVELATGKHALCQYMFACTLFDYRQSDAKKATLGMLKQCSHVC